MALNVKTADHSSDVVQQLLKLGAGRVTATMAVPFMWHTPGTSDPYSPVVIMIVQGVQRALRHLGIPTRGDGYVDRQTSAGLRRVIGPHWKAKAWTQIYSELIDALRVGRCRPTKGNRMSYRMGMGAVAASNFTFTSRGSAKAVDHGQRGPIRQTFEELQRQINRIAQASGQFGKIGVDGIIGKNTVAAATAAENACGASFIRGFPTHSVANVAEDADTAAEGFASCADQMGAPARVSAPMAKKASGGGEELVIRDPITGGLSTAKAGFVDDLMSPMGLALAGGTVLALWYIGQQTKPAKKPAKKKPTRRPTRRRPTRRRRRQARRRVTYTWF